MAHRRLLFICSEFPYPVTKGIRIRQSTQIEALSNEFDVSVAVTHSPIESGAYNLPNAQIRVEPWLTEEQSRLPSPVRRAISCSDYYVAPPWYRECHQKRFSHVIETGKFDLVWVSRLKSAWTLGQLGSIPSVLDLDEIESCTRDNRVKLVTGRGPIRRFVHWADIRALARIEREVCLRYGIVTVSARRDVNQLPFGHLRYLPNCAPANVLPNGQTSRRNGSGNILFIGTLEYDPNLHGIRWFLKDVWPRLVSLKPDIKLHVVGEGGKQQKDIVESPGVRIHGFVEDPTTIWKECDLAIVPIFAGGGTRIKILEAWQRGVPVVTTRIGIDGLEATEGVHALVADTKESFAKSCEAILSSSLLRASLVSAGTSLIEAKYSRSRVEKATLQIAHEALSMNQ